MGITTLLFKVTRGMGIGIGLFLSARQAAEVLLNRNPQISVLCIKADFVSSRPGPDCLGWYEDCNRSAREISVQWLYAGAALNPVSQTAAGPERSSFLHRAVVVQPQNFGSGKAKPQRVALQSQFHLSEPAINDYNWPSPLSVEALTIAQFREISSSLKS